MRCDQWNLVPIEERWEAVEECEAIAASAEAKGTEGEVGVASTASGLELVCVGRLGRDDIANWRYGRRLAERQRTLFWLALSLVGLAAALGVRAGIAAGSPGLGVYVALLGAIWLGHFWWNPLRIAPTTVTMEEERVRVWPWQLDDMMLDGADDDGRPAVVLPGRQNRRFKNQDAARLLAVLLPRLNGANCATASVRAAVARVTDAEKEERTHSKTVTRKGRRHVANIAARPEPLLRPWERLALKDTRVPIRCVLAEHRLALEMAVTEEVEQLELKAAAQALGAELIDEEEIASIADNLLVPEIVEIRLREAQAAARDAASREQGHEGNREG